MKKPTKKKASAKPKAGLDERWLDVFVDVANGLQHVVVALERNTDALNRIEATLDEYGAKIPAAAQPSEAGSTS